MSDELFNGFLPGFLEKLFFSHELELVHESVDVFDQDIITSDKNLLLCTAGQTYRQMVGRTREVTAQLSRKPMTKCLVLHHFSFRLYSLFRKNGGHVHHIHHPFLTKHSGLVLHFKP